MKYLITIILLVNIHLLYGQQPFVLKATVPTAFEGDSVFLRVWDCYSLNQFRTLKSDIIKNKAFSFSGIVKKPCEQAILTIKKGEIEKFWLQFVVDSGVNNIEINKVDTDSYVNKLKNVVFHSVSNNIDQKLDSVNEVYSHKKPLSLQMQKDEIKAQIGVLQQYPSEYYSLIFLRILSGRAVRDQNLLLKTLYGFDVKLRSTALGIETDSILSNELKSKISAKAGNQVPEFAVKTDKGIIFNNRSLLGKPYIIAFSATWCGPCQLYQKKLLSLYHKYRSKNLKVIYFNLDDDMAKWKKLIIDKKLDWINVSERTKFADSKIAKQFYAYAIPLYIVVNKGGKVVYNGYELHDDDHSKLEKYLENVTKGY